MSKGYIREIVSREVVLLTRLRVHRKERRDGWNSPAPTAVINISYCHTSTLVPPLIVPFLHHFILPLFRLSRNRLSRYHPFVVLPRGFPWFFVNRAIADLN